MALSKPMKGGGTYRDHLRRAETSLMQIPELDPPEFAPGFRELWDVFWRLRRSAGEDSNGMPQGIRPEAMQSWAQLNRVELNPWEIETVEEMDRVFINSAREQHNERDGR